MDQKLPDKPLSSNINILEAMSRFEQQFLSLFLSVKATHVLVCEHCSQEFRDSVLLESGACPDCLQKNDLSEDDFEDQIHPFRTALIDEIEHSLTLDRTDATISMSKDIESVLLTALNQADASALAINKIERELERRAAHSDEWEGTFDYSDYERMVYRLSQTASLESLCRIFGLSEEVTKAVLSQKIPALFGHAKEGKKNG